MDLLVVPSRWDEYDDAIANAFANPSTRDDIGPMYLTHPGGWLQWEHGFPSAPCLVSTSDRLFGIALDLTNQQMFWSTGLDDTIGRADIDGSNPVTLIIQGNPRHIGPLALDVDSGHIYWSNFGSPDSILRANLDGSGITAIQAVGESAGLALDLSAGHMYWSEHAAGRIMRSDLDGTNPATLVTGLSDPLGLALDVASGHMYWADNRDDVIYRANLDGSGQSAFITGASNAHQLAIHLGDDTLPS